MNVFANKAVCLLDKALSYYLCVKFYNDKFIFDESINEGLYIFETIS